MQNVIHEYIRERVKGKGKQIVGVMAGMVYEGVIVVGWSKANLKAGDVFDRDEGMRIASDRAKGWINAPATPIQLVEPLRTFQVRCLRYFKQAKSMATGFGGRDNDKAINDNKKVVNGENGVYIHPAMSSDDTLKAMNIVMDMILKDVGLPAQSISKEDTEEYRKELEFLDRMFPRFFR